VQIALRILDLSARLLLALGVGCLLLAAYLSWLTLSFASDAARTTGEVVSYHEIPDGNSMRYRPRVRFKTETGEIVSVEPQMSITGKRFAIGEKVPMIYQRAKPTDSRIALFADKWLGATIAAVIGLVGLAGGFLVRRGVRREISKP
jgi:hypothetical protein